MRTTEAMVEWLKKHGAAFVAKPDVEVTPAELKSGNLVFLHTDLGHNDVLEKRNDFYQFLRKGGLGELQ